MDLLDKLAAKIGGGKSSSSQSASAVEYHEELDELREITSIRVNDAFDSGDDEKLGSLFKVKEHINCDNTVDICELVSSDRKSLGDTLFRYDITKSYNNLIAVSDNMEQIAPIDINDEDIIGKRMPFLNKRMDFGTWVYKNRYGVISTMIIYILLLFGIQFFTLEVKSPDLSAGILISLEHMEDMEELLEDEIEELKEENEKLEAQNDLREQMAIENRLLDEYFEKQMEDAVSEPKEQDIEDITQENEGEELTELDKILARNEAAFSEKQNNKGENSKNKIPRVNVSKAGNVTVSASLKDRYVVRPEVPAYRCRGGGKVVVEIIVGRNGLVIDASIVSSKQIVDECLLIRSLEAAKLTEFNIDNNAPKRQYGLITFQFVAQ